MPSELPLKGPAPAKSTEAKPDYLKRLDSIPFSGIESNSAAEIREFLKSNHHITYASLQNPEGSAGQIPWKQPHLIKFTDPLKLVRHPRLNLKASAARGQAKTSYAATSAENGKPNTVVQPELEYHTPSVRIDTSKHPMIVLTDPSLVSNEKDPRLNKPKTQVGLVKSTYNLRSQPGRALSTQVVDPLALAQKPVHKPAIERLNRGVQLKHRQQESTSTTKGNLANNIYDIYPANHPLSKRQNARFIALLPDQVFLDHLQKFPANFAFNAGFCKRLYIRGGSRIDPKASEAKKPTRCPRFGRAAITKLLVDNQKEIMEKGEAEQDVAERMGNASI